MRVADLDYHLPPHLIAAEPAEPRDAARLMVVDRAAGRVEHRHVRDLPDAPGGPRRGDLLVFNDSRVIPASFHGTRAATGGRVGGLYIEQAQADAAGGPTLWRIMLESRGSLRPGEIITLADDSRLILRARDEDAEHLAIWTAELHSPLDTLALLARIGSPPLPPYIRKTRRRQGRAEIEVTDADRYNTVYAAAPGSVAAPTAGLHFTDALLHALDQRGVLRAAVTLHVGPGTFAPVRCDDLSDHPMHEEWISVPSATLAALAETRGCGGRIIPVGTTSVRALESLDDRTVRTNVSNEPFVTRTRLLIQPGSSNEPFPFRFTDALMTNFHLPRSTLLALVAALPGVGIERLKTWYGLAADRGYRFYSYGDAMWLA